MPLGLQSDSGAELCCCSVESEVILSCFLNFHYLLGIVPNRLADYRLTLMAVERIQGFYPIVDVISGK